MSDRIAPPPRTSEVVVGRITDLIRSGEWSVGSRIPAEPDLVERFGVGRNTIREAVRALEHAGMLVPRRGDGTYVRSRNVLAAAIERCVPTSELVDLTVARRAVEAEAAAVAADRATPEQIADLRGHLAVARTAVENGGLDVYAQADIAFHAAMVAASNNGLLVELHAAIAEVMGRLHESVFGPTVAEGVHPAGHADVVDAIAAGDASAARAAVHSYLDHAPGQSS
ncbi:FCD domain-containing protein [Gordonia sp. CPCC 206044]|uniref:FadR/GntR family transcriptional regulator n=1 Tax=Gordonia sp. CPCC 206044 TaxID=3140793 RepID=UPI003AF395CB